MQQKQLAALWLLALGAQAIHCFDLGKLLSLGSKRNLFAELNERLTRATDSPEPGANFRALAEADELGDNELAELAHNFLKLSQLTEANLCATESQDVLHPLWHALRKSIDENPIEYVAGRPGERAVAILIGYLKQYKLMCHHEPALNWRGKKVRFASSFAFEWPRGEPSAGLSGGAARRQQLAEAIAADGFAQLDQFLATRVKSLDLQDNLEAVQRLHELERDSIRQNPAFEAAVRQFLSLGQLNAKNLCDKRSADLADEVFEAVGRRSAGANPFAFPRSRRRLGAVLVRFFRERATACLRKYALEWDKPMAKFMRRAELQNQLYVYKRNIMEHGWCARKPGRLVTGDNEHLHCALYRSFDHELDELEDLNPILATLRELLGERALSELAGNARAVERQLDKLLYKQCKQLLGSKHAIALDKTFRTLLTVDLSDNLLRAARNYQRELEIPFKNLVNWTTSYANCARLLETNKSKLVEALSELARHENVDELLQETTVKFEEEEAR